MRYRRRLTTTILSLILVLLFCSCVPATAPAAGVQNDIKPALAENLGLKDALTMLVAEVNKLGRTSFVTPSAYKDQMKAILSGIQDVTDQADKGDYASASSILESKVSMEIEKSVAGNDLDKLKQILLVVNDAITNASKTTLDIKTGKVAGAAGHEGSWVWKGIPYAKPPVGDLRWRAPADPEPWKGVRHSTDTVNMATQVEKTKLHVTVNNMLGSEDCLYLNVWRPRNDDKNLPVYFWIHGGGNIYGSIKQYEAGQLASRSNMVVVSIDYRLGPLGWFNHPALKKGMTPEESSGNFGTLDTIKALQWVRNNIRAFGGNPDNVTIAGESAGAHNSMNLIVSPLAAGLFHRALFESGGMKPMAVTDGIAKANGVIEKMLINDGTVKNATQAFKYRDNMSDAEIAKYLRNASAAEVVRAQPTDKLRNMFCPAFIDGTVIPDTWPNLIESGKYNRVPIIIGSNEYEMKPFQPLVGGFLPTSNGLKWSDLYKVMDGKMKLDEVLASQLDKDIYEASGYYSSRNWKAVNVDATARKLREKQDNVYCYLFKWGGKGSGSEPYDFILGAGHGAEIPFFFGSDRDSFGYTFTEQNKQGRLALQKSMMAYVAQFARAGDPNAAGSGLPRWEAWSNTAGGPKSVVFDATFTDAKISMMTEEVTADGVRDEVQTLPADVMNIVKLWLGG